MAAVTIPRVRSAPRCVWPLAATLGESACWSVRDRALYFVDILGRHLHRYAPASGATGSWDFDEEISALAERAHAHGLLVSLRHHLALFDLDSGRLTRLHRPPLEPDGNRFNDGKCDARGRFWAGSMDHAGSVSSGALYCFDGAGHCTRHLDSLHIANGPTWSADGRTMLLNETGPARTWALAFDPERGTLGERRLWRQHDVAALGAPDGMTTDAAGRIWIARWGGSAVTCHAPDGEQLLRIELPTAHVSSCTFGGADLDTLYVTTATTELSAAERAAQPLAGGLFAIELDVVGLPAHCFAG